MLSASSSELTWRILFVSRCCCCCCPMCSNNEVWLCCNLRVHFFLFGVRMCVCVFEASVNLSFVILLSSAKKLHKYHISACVMCTLYISSQNEQTSYTNDDTHIYYIKERNRRNGIKNSSSTNVETRNQ